MKHIIQRVAIYLCASTCTASMAQAIAIRPLTAQQQQEAEEKVGLASNIKAVAMPSNSPNAPIALPIQRAWTLKAGLTNGQNLKAWGESAGWEVLWNMPKDWTVPASTTFYGEFPEVAEAVIKTLAANGALVRAQIYDGNKTMVISGPGVAQQ